MGSSKSLKIPAILSQSANLKKIITNLISSKRREFSNFWKIPFIVRIGSLYHKRKLRIMIPLKPSIRFFFLFSMRMDKNRALNENVCSILLFFMNTIKSLSPFTDQEYAHSCNILYCLVCLVLKIQMSVLCATSAL